MERPLANSDNKQQNKPVDPRHLPGKITEPPLIVQLEFICASAEEVMLRHVARQACLMTARAEWNEKLIGEVLYLTGGG